MGGRRRPPGAPVRRSVWEGAWGFPAVALLPGPTGPTGTQEGLLRVLHLTPAVVLQICSCPCVLGPLRVAESEQQ